MSPLDPRLEELKRRLQDTEADLRKQGYRTERTTAHAGYLASNQQFGEEILILVLFGTLLVECQTHVLQLGPGDHFHVPAGVPYQLSVRGQETAYWIQAHRKELQNRRRVESNAR